MLATKTLEFHTQQGASGGGRAVAMLRALLLSMADMELNELAKNSGAYGATTNSQTASTAKHPASQQPGPNQQPKGQGLKGSRTKKG
ncbi:MAG: hypothetical protein ACK59A_03280, partial [Cyanobacteriota bacterium]